MQTKTKEVKSEDIIFWIMTFLPLAITLILLPSLPDIIPAHMNAAGEIDRWGSKYEVLILPAISIAVMLLYRGMLNVTYGKYGRYKKIATLLFSVSGLVFLVLNIVWLFYGFTATESTDKTNISQSIWAATGMMFIVAGNFLPKMKKDFYFGIRTKWTLENEIVWFKTHRFAGKFFVAVGIAVIILCGFVVDGEYGFLTLLSAFIFSILVTVLYSFIIDKKYNQKHL